MRRSARFAPAHLPFFAAAFAFAAVAVPWWTAVWHGVAPPPCGSCHLPAHHGHEMLFGFAAALMAGFLFSRVGRPALALAFAAWLAARAAMALDAPPLLLAAVLPLPLVALFWWGGRPFLKAAKTARNMIPGLVVLALLAIELAYVLARLGLWQGERASVLAAFSLVALMLFVMGGRILAAASAGALRLKGLTLPQKHLVRREWEWAGVAGLALMGMAESVGLALPAAVGAGVAGVAGLVRLCGWRPWRLYDDPALWPLHLGYAWLGVGLLAKAAAQGAGLLPPTAGLHLVTIGALGCLGAGVASRTAHQRAGRAGPQGPALPLAAMLFSVAAVLRAGLAWHPWLLPASAAVFALAGLGMALYLARAGMRID